ncbi:MAG: prolipoprotein diacylglyceryl transferase [Burkholderiaceae bacterium]|nr:prolipoprotein diacylglyceryl transferase [Burkholderiaceae bacterium]
MINFPQIDPIAIKLGPLEVHWYGLMYLIGFGSAWLLGRWRVNRKLTRVTLVDFEDLIFMCMIGVVLGGRLGYVFFYKPAYYLSNPLEIFYLWQGGMSFHGGLLGVLAMMALFAKRRDYKFLELGDLMAPLIPLGLAAGRMGNFINGELWGRPTDLPWGMVFPGSADGIARHPSQLYQFGLEGLTLFVLIWWFARLPRPTGQVSAVFLIGYGMLRFLAEYAREPDAFLGLLAANLSMGQWLCIPMIAIGIVIYRNTLKKT